MQKSTRRNFVKGLFGSACGLPAVATFAPLAARRAYGQEVGGKALGKTDFARIEELADGVYALVSTPFSAAGKAVHTATHSNGGLIVGNDRVLAIDSYRTVEGARFLAEASLKIAGRLPTHVVHTHFHFDHLGGTQGLISGESAPEILMTQTTRELAYQTYLKVGEAGDDGFAKSTIGKWGGRLTDATKVILDEQKELKLDLGGRSVTIIPMRGHTGSDLVVTDGESGVTFAGDLMWDGIFPNFMSSTPSVWRKSVKQILRGGERMIVPGHGSVQRSGSNSYKMLEVLMDEVEQQARMGMEEGRSADEVAATFKISESAGDWRYFREGFHELAMAAWYRELGAG